MSVLEQIISTNKLKQIENKQVYNCLTQSRSSEFYAKTFSETFQREDPELYHASKVKHKQNGMAYKIMDEIVGFLEKELPAESIVIEIGGGIYQQRSSNAYKRLKYYFPLGISQTNMIRYSTRFELPSIVADAKELPFKDNSIDCIFTHTFLEHPLEPEEVLKEIIRVLKPGGIVVHNDAWFCRWWQRFAIVGLRRYSNLTFKEKMIWLAAKITEISIIRIPPIIIRRFIQETFSGQKKNQRLKYRKLTPNYELHLGCDEDAANRIDPLDVVRFYESRNFHLVNQLSFTQRLFYPNKYITLSKNGGT